MKCGPFLLLTAMLGPAIAGDLLCAQNPASPDDLSDVVRAQIEIAREKGDDAGTQDVINILGSFWSQFELTQQQIKEVNQLVRDRTEQDVRAAFSQILQEMARRTQSSQEATEPDPPKNGSNDPPSDVPKAEGGGEDDEPKPSREDLVDTILRRFKGKIVIDNKSQYNLWIYVSDEISRSPTQHYVPRLSTLDKAVPISNVLKGTVTTELRNEAREFVSGPVNWGEDRWIEVVDNNGRSWMLPIVIKATR